VAQDVATVDRLTRENLRCIRPGAGLAPKHYDALLGRRVRRDVKRGTPMSWGLLEGED
jgi:N-acetylneuraminate synthase